MKYIKKYEMIDFQEDWEEENSSGGNINDIKEPSFFTIQLSDNEDYYVRIFDIFSGGNEEIYSHMMDRHTPMHNLLITKLVDSENRDRVIYGLEEQNLYYLGIGIDENKDFDIHEDLSWDTRKESYDGYTFLGSIEDFVSNNPIQESIDFEEDFEEEEPFVSMDIPIDLPFRDYHKYLNRDVMIKPTSPYYTSSPYNPMDIIGKIVRLNYEYSDDNLRRSYIEEGEYYVFTVEWANGKGNSYRPDDLVLLSNIKESIDFEEDYEEVDPNPMVEYPQTINGIVYGEIYGNLSDEQKSTCVFPIRSRIIHHSTRDYHEINGEQGEVVDYEGDGEYLIYFDNDINGHDDHDIPMGHGYWVGEEDIKPLATWESVLYESKMKNIDFVQDWEDDDSTDINSFERLKYKIDEFESKLLIITTPKNINALQLKLIEYGVNVKLNKDNTHQNGQIYITLERHFGSRYGISYWITTLEPVIRTHFLEDNIFDFRNHSPEDFTSESFNFQEDWEDEEDIEKINGYSLVYFGEKSRLFLKKGEYLPITLGIGYKHGWPAGELTYNEIKEFVSEDLGVHIYDPTNILPKGYKDPESGYGWKLIPISILKLYFNIENI